jgi:hypothetical protein
MQEQGQSNARSMQDQRKINARAMQEQEQDQSKASAGLMAMPLYAVQLTKSAKPSRICRRKYFSQGIPLKIIEVVLAAE